MVNPLIETIPISIVIALIFYLAVIYVLYINIGKRQPRERFYRAILTILERNQDDQQCVPEIFITFKKISERSSAFRNTYKSAVDVVEDFLVRSDTLTADRFKSIYHLEVSQSDKKRIVNIIKLIKLSDPFSSVSSKFNGIFNMLRHSLNTNNKDLGQSMLNQMADDVEILERTIYTQQRTNLAAIIVSIVGVVLTLVFGIFTIAPLFFTN